jgi:WD40 repeat protein
MPFPGPAVLTFDGAYAAVIDRERPAFLLWDTRTIPEDDGGSDLPPRELDWSVDSQHGLEVEIGFLPRCLALASGHSLLAVAGDGLALYDAATSSKRERSAEGGPITALAFTPDGQELVAGTENGLLQSWDVHSGKLRQSLTGNTGPIRSVAVSPDGQVCAAGTETGEVVLWDRA